MPEYSQKREIELERNVLVVNHRKIKTMTAKATTTLITSPMNGRKEEKQKIGIINARCRRAEAL